MPGELDQHNAILGEVQAMRRKGKQQKSRAARRSFLKSTGALAAGLSVAIPALIFHRYLTGKVDRLVIAMEAQALKLLDVMHGEREAE